MWVLPVVAGALAITGLGLGFVRWRRAAYPARLIARGGGGNHRSRPHHAARAGRGQAHRLRQRVTLVAGAALVVLAGALWLVDRSSSPRLPGATITGGLSGVNAELQEASAITASDPTEALALYDDVLSGDPDQPVALTAEGWNLCPGRCCPQGDEPAGKGRER